jgi:hypothetical protein
VSEYDRASNMRPIVTNTQQRLALSGMLLSVLMLLVACGSGSSTTLPSALTQTPTSASTPSASPTPSSTATPVSSPIVSQLDPDPPQGTFVCAYADTFKSGFTGSDGSNYLIEVDLAERGCMTGDVAFSFSVSAPFLSWSDSAVYVEPSGKAQATIALVRPGQMGQGLEGSSIVVVYSPQTMTIDSVTVIGKGSPIGLQRQ